MTQRGTKHSIKQGHNQGTSITLVYSLQLQKHGIHEAQCIMNQSQTVTRVHANGEMTQRHDTRDLDDTYAQANLATQREELGKHQQTISSA
jgi:hypothetical protein